MRLYQLEYFIKVAECGSITKAAQKLYLSQPSLTKAISGLESEYGVKLLRRTSKGISLTSKGRDFLQYARNAVDSCNILEQAFGKKGNPLVQRIAIASQQFDFIYDILLKLYGENEKELLQIDFIESDRGEIIEKVEKRMADIGLLVLSEEDSKGFKTEVAQRRLEAHTLDRSGVYVCMGRHSKLFGRDSVDILEAEKYPHLVLDTEQTMRRELRYRVMYQGLDKGRLVFCNTAGVCRKFLEETNALLFIPKWVIGLFIEPDIHVVPLKLEGGDYPPVNRLVWIKHEKEEFQPLEKRFMELLEGYFKQAQVI